MDNEQIVHNFTNHPPENDEIATKLDDITTEFVIMAKMLNRTLPESREKALAITNLEQCSMWSKAAVARNQEG